MITLQQIQQYSTLIRDIIIIVTAIILAVIAIMGIHAWKRQLKGNTEYEIARNLLRSIYKTREAIRQVRNPFASASEMSASIRDSEIDTDLNDPLFHSKSQAALYQKRWKAIQEALPELDLGTFEADVIWGNDVKELIVPLRKLITQLNSNIEMFLRSLQDASWGIDYSEMQEKIEEVIYDLTDFSKKESTNSFTIKVNETITNIENYLRQKMKH